jgi:two-component system, OmpR family, KDP operon response regulator KdpE
MFTYRETNEMDLMAAGEKRAARPKRRSKIMIVDDDADLCHALGLRLRANHYETLSTGDGYSALALAQKERPDLVLLDLGLPGFATGAAVLKQMRAFPSVALIPVIVITGRDSRDYEQPMLELGAAGCFQKPVDEEELLNLIGTCLTPNSGKDGLPAIRFRLDPESGRFSRGRTT